MSENTLQNLRIAVTGHNGFIGSWFVKTLRSLNVPVIIMEGDIRSAKTWDKEFDVLYHFASRMSQKFNHSVDEAFSVNINGTFQALEACRRNKAHMVFTSTCGVYKPGSAEIFCEKSEIDPPTAYTQSKVIGEMLCRSHANQYNVKTTVLRLFNVYGPGQDDHYIIPYLIQCALGDHKAEVCHPDSYRDFVNIRDVVDVLLHVIKVKETFNIYNVGSGQSHTIAEIIQVISQACNKTIEFQKKESRDDPQPVVYAKIDKIDLDLQWRAKIDLKDGIQEMINTVYSKVL